METKLTRPSNTTRQRVILFLAFLSSPECQEACARHITGEELGFELCRLWFDDIYVPGGRYIDGWKESRSRADGEQFWATFTEEEQAALERFHRFLELRLDMLPDEALRQEVFPQNNLWMSITRDASHALEALLMDADGLRQELMWVVRAVVLEQLENE